MSPKLAMKSRAQRTEEMRQSILDASLELFVEQGFEKTTTRQITQKVGILNGSLYNIYKSKDDIFTDIALRAVRECVSSIDLVVGKDADFREKFCFPICIQVYASSRSPRIAELLSVAHEHKAIQRKIVEFHRNVFLEKGVSGFPMNDDNEFELRATACSGAMSLILRRIMEAQDEIDERSAMRILCSMNLMAFNLSLEDVTEYVDKVVDNLQTHELEICGIRI